MLSLFYYKNMTRLCLIVYKYTNSKIAFKYVIKLLTKFVKMKGL